VSGGIVAPWPELRVVDLTRSTTVSDAAGRVRVRTVEHLTSALAGLSLHDGVEIEVVGPELPILDGGAEAWRRASAALGVRPSLPRLEIVRNDVLETGRSRMELALDGDDSIAVTTTFGDPRVDDTAVWRKDAFSYASEIAPARTFAFAADVAGMVERGLARHVPPESVLVIASDVVHCAGRPFASSEPARHKLLDLIGDFHLHGGPPRGGVHVVRPGHAANHALIDKALERGSLARRA
jgi:UDP-3-O-[3-hydroxymyristoyl] N-acetylglucosamine deacetylase